MFKKSGGFHYSRRKPFNNRNNNNNNINSNNNNESNNNTKNNKRRRKASSNSKNNTKLGLDEIIKKDGGPCGYGINDDDDNYYYDTNGNNNSNNNTDGDEKVIRKERVFYSTPKPSSSSSSINSSSQGKKKINNPYKTGSNNTSTVRKSSSYNNKNNSPFTLSSNTSSNNNRTPYSSYSSSSTTSTNNKTKKLKSSRVVNKHILCAIAENLGHETCISKINAINPTHISCYKQGNGSTYVETLELLKQLNPDEILLNEGRRNSQLMQKILKLYSNSEQDKKDDDGTIASVLDDMQSHKPEQTVIKFVPRHYFDQTKGAELLRKICRSSINGINNEDHSIVQGDGASLSSSAQQEQQHNYDVSAIEDEYVILASSYAILQYTQVTLGISFARESLNLYIDYSGGCSSSSSIANTTSTTKNNSNNTNNNRRMVIDRSTITHLELLSNAKTGKSNNNCLISTIDHTKTSVGSRLLRSNLCSPPCKLITIECRHNLVDIFLNDEEFFYLTLEYLEALPDLDKMMTHFALVPNKSGQQQIVTSRMASKGISALVCIKSTLSVIPSFAQVIEEHLLKIGENKPSLSSSSSSRSNHTKRSYHHNHFQSSSASSSTTVSSNIYSNNNETATTTTSRSDDSQNPSTNTTTTAQSNENNSNNEMKDETTNYTKNSSFKDDSKYNDDYNNDDNDNNNDEETDVLSYNTANYLETNDTNSNSNSNNNELLNAILLAMQQPQLSEILNEVTNIFTESTTYTRNSHAMRHQECFALKPNTDGMMDVLRKAFLANVDDIYKLADSYSEEFDIIVSVKESSSRGYYLSLPADRFIGGCEDNNGEFTLPPIFIQPVKNRRYIECTTEEIYSLNARAQENVSDLLLMTHSRIQEVIEFARNRYDSLASLSDAIALLDMCHSFADNVVSSRLSWCRPVMSDMTMTVPNNTLSASSTNANSKISFGGSGALAIKKGRYPIISVQNSKDKNVDYIPNDTYTSSVQNFTLITGINGSGKTKYLKQIAIIVILAHCGSYVPADEAFIPVRDRICTRIGNSDDLEHNISSFLLEMKETAFACNYATDKSLILVDELGRATSNEDGMAIAWAISEFLLVKRSITFFATHYSQLTKLANIYPNVQNQHLSANVKNNEQEGGGGGGGVVMQYFHKVLPGPCKMESDYGVDMAVICGWPMDVIHEARKLRSEVEEKLPDEAMCQHQLEDCGGLEIDSNMNIMKARKEAESVLLELAKHLVALKESYNRLCSDAQRSYLQDLKERMVPKENINVIEQMNNILRFDVEISDEPKKDMPATSNTAQDSIKYDIPNSKSEVCYMNTSEEDIDVDSKDADLTLPQTLQSVQKEAQNHPLTNKHNHLDLKRSVSSHASCINLMNRNGSSYNTSVADESYSLNSKDKKGSPKSKVFVKNEIIDARLHQQHQPELIVIDDQTLSDSEIINLDDDDDDDGSSSNTSHSSNSSSNPSANQKVSSNHNDDSSSGSSSVSNASTSSSSSNSSSSSESSTSSSNSDSCSSDNDSNN